MSRPKLKALIFRSPTPGHLAELLLYLSGRGCGIILQALHLLSFPLNRLPFLFKIRWWLLLGILRALKTVSPPAHALLMEPPKVIVNEVVPEEGQKQKAIDSLESDVDVSFIGCSWLMIYHIGAAKVLLEAGVIQPGTTILGGSSSGSLVATALAANVDMEELKQLIFQMASDSQRRLLGPLGLMSYYVQNGLEKLLPRDALQRIKHTLRVSVTRFGDHHPHPSHPHKRALALGLGVRSEIVDHFSSREELMHTLLSSCFIPGYYEKPSVSLSPYHPQYPYLSCLGLDGGATCNLLPAKITLSPYSGTADISPSPSNAFPAIYSLFPPTGELEKVYEAGTRDAQAFLAKNPHYANSRKEKNVSGGAA